jgi:hypothetical protein
MTVTNPANRDTRERQLDQMCRSEECGPHHPVISDCQIQSRWAVIGGERKPTGDFDDSDLTDLVSLCRLDGIVFSHPHVPQRPSLRLGPREPLIKKILIVHTDSLHEAGCRSNPAKGGRATTPDSVPAAPARLPAQSPDDRNPLAKNVNGGRVGRRGRPSIRRLVRSH